ncbi:uncharacterized protein LOC120354546 [Nilaparvata lugens]|uniref:uncharacterized protein LOC120354546 n=1 Tax=Nilaparvata lugens TaxID=108931 RepID=UPI00193E6ABF|nr:uncharacterized protein LOC120354546 [Nilaparvata lugens]
MDKLLIVSANQGKWFNQYLNEFADTGLDVTVNFRSGRKVQEIDSAIVEQTCSFTDVVLHLGTNNIPDRFDSPPIIVKRMHDLVGRILMVNPTCRIHITSILPRQRNDFQYGTERQRQSRDYQRHMDFIDFCNSKVNCIILR